MLNFAVRTGPLTGLTPTTDYPHFLGWPALFGADTTPPEPPPPLSYGEPFLDLHLTMLTELGIETIFTTLLDLDTDFKDTLDIDTPFRSTKIDLDVQ